MNDRAAYLCGAMRWITPIALFLGVLLFISATAKDYGVAWDEPPYYHAADLHLKWIVEVGDNLLRDKLSKSLDDVNIKAAWHWNPYNVPHPPFSRIISAIAKNLSGDMVDKFTAYRLAPALFFAVLVTVIYLWLNELFGPSAGLFAASALMLIPNLFGYAHIAVTDLPLATMWFLTVYCFYKGLTGWQWSIALGVVWGLALSTKFPALLIPVPLIVWAHLFHRDKYANNILSLVFLAPLVMVATQPYLWHQTGLRVLEFLYEGISRGYRADANFGVFFLNQILLSQQLPWHYPFYIVAVTTPEPILLLALIGILSAIWLREQRSILLLLTLSAAFVLILGVLPGAVLHDGVRQMLSALPFIAALAGVGFFVLTAALVKVAHRSESLQRINNLKAKVTAAFFVLVCVNPAIDLYLEHPFQLSYYNRLVGGIRGAYERGLETTYFMEAITPAFVQRLNEKLPHSATVNASFANFMFEFYQNQGILRRDIRFSSSGTFDFYLVLNRRSALSPQDRQVTRSSARLVDSVTLAGVPLVALFDLRKTQ
ncbi:MAG TPA: glycosyltransferase family 39 protein [Pyrinomonadaceae bacterium]|nr:glycosyltransferase family 39 protein [Pyrinomonadaceae bacterium]